MMEIIGAVIGTALWLYMLVLLARMVLGWVPVITPEWSPRGPVLVAAEFVYTLTDPPLRFLRRFVPSLNLGSVSLDLSFMVLWLGVFVLMRVNAAIF